MGIVAGTPYTEGEDKYDGQDDDTPAYRVILLFDDLPQGDPKMPAQVGGDQQYQTQKHHAEVFFVKSQTIQRAVE